VKLEVAAALHAAVTSKDIESLDALVVGAD
jgi:hypothetical protein